MRAFLLGAASAVLAIAILVVALGEYDAWQSRREAQRGLERLRRGERP